MTVGDNNDYEWCEGRWRCPQELDAPFCDWAWGLERRSVRNAQANAEAATTTSSDHLRADDRSQSIPVTDTTFYLVVDDDVEPVSVVVTGDTDEDDRVLEVLRLVKVERGKTRDN
jgi:hypothetical protein